MFNASEEFCVNVAILPRLLYHPYETLLAYWESEKEGGPQRDKRESITALTTGTPFTLGLAGASTGVVAWERRLDVSLVIHRDLEQLRQTLSDLEESLTSLSEVVLEHRRRLDLLFLKV